MAIALNSLNLNRHYAIYFYRSDNIITPILQVNLPLRAEAAVKLRAGELVEISGVVYTARDQAHKRLVAALEAGEEIPIALTDQTIYYAGPAPGANGRTIGSIGPTTSSRMDTFTPRLLSAGVRALIGKGDRSPAVVDAIKENLAVYFVAVGGAAAYLSQFIHRADIVAWPELGPEAIYKLDVKNFPAVVAIDSKGGNIFNKIKKP